MNLNRRYFFSFLAIFAFAISQISLAGANGPDIRQAAAKIDAILAGHWHAKGVKANPPAGDEIFLRRAYLDLAGRIPTAQEVRAFLDSKLPDRRSALIVDLLARESYVSHFYNFWADILRLKTTYINTSNVVPAAYAKWIKESLRTNMPYDQFVRELLSAKGLAWDNGAVGYYMRDPDMPLDNMALTSRVFLGTRIECAQCHDHPFDKWKQTEFYHLAAYTIGNKSINESPSGMREAFKRREDEVREAFLKEKKSSTDGGKAAETRREERMAAIEFRPTLNIIRQGIGQLLSPVGQARSKDATLKLPHDFNEPNGKPGDVMRPATLFGGAAEVASGDDSAAVFARWVASPDNPRFTRVIVNRLWKKMFGAPLSEFYDDLKDGMVPMVPELEPHLEKLMVELRFDMKAFLAALAHTKAYQAAVSLEEFELGRPYHFTGPLLRRMTAEQVWDSPVALASYEPDARDLVREARDQRRIDVSRMVYDAYANFGGEKLVELGYARLRGEKELQKRETIAREAAIEARRTGEKERETALKREQGALNRERNEAFVREFLTPLVENLARVKNGEITVDESYKMNPNPAVLAVETWRKTHVTGYGPKPKTPAELQADAAAEKERIEALLVKSVVPESERSSAMSYFEKTRSEWVRASELESPAPRGHFLRTMGQSDRDFVENANPNASIPQALALMNGDTISGQVVLSPYSPLMQSIARSEDKHGAAYIAILGRQPTTAERQKLKEFTIDDVVYALLNTKQFIFIQ